MHPTDRAILEHCANEFQPVVPLKGRIPSGSLYRHVNRLVRLAWLEKTGGKKYALRVADVKVQMP